MIDNTANKMTSGVSEGILRAEHESIQMMESITSNFREKGLFLKNCRAKHWRARTIAFARNLQLIFAL